MSAPPTSAAGSAALLLRNRLAFLRLLASPTPAPVLTVYRPRATASRANGNGKGRPQ